MLKKFYAVTVLGEALEISDDQDELGKLLGISDLGICRFDPTSTHERSFEKMNVADWGGKTDPIVGLFLEESNALECLARRDRALFSSAYILETCKVLESIGLDHPIFVIGDSVVPYAVIEMEI